MDPAVIQLLVLAGIAVFLIMRLRSVLGSRDGFEKPPVNGPAPQDEAPMPRRFEVIEGGPDTDITDHVPEDSDTAKALGRMKAVDPDFNVTEFLSGARGAYEMILMSFENGTLDDILPFLSRDVFESFDEVVQLRERENLRVDAEFVGVRELSLTEATFDEDSAEAEITVRFIGELTSVVRNAEGEIVEGDPNVIKRQKDIWTFARNMKSDSPNWKLVATGG
ncbi:Tim44 domain-containing protein [Rhodobacteraceae bacterium 2376]|uniref:Tim44 domain-containing protein n=1 Tax=Rhabdonatronobacter sediminivivens TaxID=2743469 RepID=A0A7Z0I3J3_9RHOB|nr:Tim44/TimA family putative adaptor protein [Rhabdonatronobacter sediminivivens]NYS26807.1 Tim44 domain-containing protein [Rhabdonatronobacter sediminivivens]